MQDYLNQKDLIPKGNLIEVCFDDLEMDPLGIVSSIYEDLKLPGYHLAEPRFKAYVNKMKSYKKNTHVLTSELIDKIMKEWGFAMNKWDYKLPSHIEILKDVK